MTDDKHFSTANESCPECGNPIPVHDRFPKWCPDCNWNLSPPEYSEPSGPIGKYFRTLGDKSAKRLFEAYISIDPEKLRPRLTVSKLAALAITIVVHLLSILVALTGLFTIVLLWPHVLPIILGVVLLGFAWMLRPRLGSMPANCVTPAQLPGVFNLVHEICDCLSVRRIDHIVVSADVNASIQYCGIRQQPVLTIGLPLWTILDDQQRLAVLAHEISHCANGDPLRGVVVSTALNTLTTWHDALNQESYGDEGLAEATVGLFMKLGALIVELAIWGLSHLVWRDSQKAEYLADYLATTICSTSAMVEALDRIRVSAESLEQLLLANVVSHSQSGAEIVSTFRHYNEVLPEHERERIRRIGRMTEARLDDSHPPTDFRISFLQHHPVSKGRVVLGGERASAVDREMAAFEEPVGKWLIYAVLGDGQ